MPAAAPGRVAADGAVGQRGRAEVDHAAAAVAPELLLTAVGQRGRAAVVNMPAPADAGGVAADGAVVQLWPCRRVNRPAARAVWRSCR